MSMLRVLLVLCFALFADSVFGAHVRQEWEFTWETGAPDGKPREMIRTNGQFPGPPLILNEGDEVEVTVHNCMPFNTTIHWHGLEQRGTPWADGVPGLTQKPIEPGESFVYRFHAGQYGTYWYHAHSRGTLQDGLYGPILIRPKPGTPTPFHLISNDSQAIEAMRHAAAHPQFLVLSDWDHLTSWEYMAAEETTGLGIFCVDSILINGKGSVYCKSPDFLKSLVSPILGSVLQGTPVTDRGCLPVLPATQGDYPYDESLLPPGLVSGCVPSEGSTEIIEVDPAAGWVSLNFIGAASIKGLVFSIDEHPMWIYAVDGAYVEPFLVDSSWIWNGERYAAMVKLDKPHGEYTIRVSDTGGDQIISGFATMSYKGGKDLGPSKPYIDYGGSSISKDSVMLLLRTLPPFNVQPPAKVADVTHHLVLGRLDAAWKWSLDGKELYPADRDAYHPILFDLDSADQHTSLNIRTINGTWVDLIFHIGVNAHEPVQAPHVIHKHSNKGYIIGSGFGPFPGTTVAEAIKVAPAAFNLENPSYKDTYVTNPIATGEAGPHGELWMAVRYQVVNPGPFLLHCHIETHLEGGMALALLDGVDKWPEVPEEYQIEHREEWN